MLFQYDEQGEQLGQEPEPPEQREPPEQPEPPEQQQELPEEPLPEEVAGEEQGEQFEVQEQPEPPGEVADGGPRDSHASSGCRMPWATITSVATDQQTFHNCLVATVTIFLTGCQMSLR